MAIAVKGIQYSFQIDFFNQVPTHVKSQVHDLPVLSVLQPTPIDRNIGRDTVILNNDDRYSYAGVRAAPQIQSPSTDIEFTTPADVVEAAPPPAISPVLVDTSVAEPTLIQRRTQSEASISRPATPPIAETTGEFVVARTDLPAPPPSELPREDANPVEQVKGIPRADFNRALRAYKPDAGTFLQPAGYEKADFNRTEYFAEPEKAAAPALPAASPVKEVYVPGVTENKAQTIETQSPEATVKPAFKGSTDPLAPVETDLQSKTQLKGENFLARQAFKLYEMIASTGILNTGNQVDFYF